MSKLENIDINSFVYDGYTVKKGNKYYIISKSPFNNEVLVFRCNAHGKPKNFKRVLRSNSFKEAKKDLINTKWL